MTAASLRPDVLRSSPLPLRVLAARRREPDRRPDPAGAGVRAARRRDHRPRQSARGVGVPGEGEEGGHQADHRHGGVRRAGLRRERGAPDAGGKPYYHLVLLARDAVGYKNLIKLSSLAYTEGFYTKPRVDRELLAKYSEGIIVSSACLAGEVAQHLMDNRVDAAREAAAWYAEVFKDRYYLEVQAHTSEGQTDPQLEDLRARRRAWPARRRHERRAFPPRRRPRRARRAALHRTRQGSQRRRPHALRPRPVLQERAGDRRRSSASAPTSLENTLKIADEVDVEFSKTYHVPAFPLPEGVATENELLTTPRARRAPRSATAIRCPAKVSERLDYELGVITKTGYAGYFLIVWDFIQAARDRGHSGRAGSRLGGRFARRLRAAHHRRRPAPLRSALRALPESGARVDARRRRRLLLRAPRRSHRVRAPEVRTRIGLPDRDVRHDEVARGHQGRRPHARLHAGRKPTRSRS